MKAIIAGAVLLSTGAMAHDTHFSTDSCDVDLNAGFSIKNNVITMTKHDKAIYKIVDGRTLIINSETIALNAAQQEAVSQYAAEIKALIPEVKGIATDAIELASEGVSIAFDELLGEDNKVGNDLSSELYSLKQELDERFDVNNFTIEEDGTVQGDFLSEDFEQRIESIVEKTVENSMGTLLIAVGQELLLAGGDMDAFEHKMEKFGEQIEYEMESRANVIEQRGEKLCYSIEKIDLLEEKLKSIIPEMPKVNVVSVDNSQHKKA